MQSNAQLGHVLVTGGTGFFGSAILKYLLDTYCETQSGPSVTVLSRSPEAFLAKNPEFKNHTWLKFHTGNLLNPKTYPSKDSFTHILHAAADSTLGYILSPLERYRQIVEGTDNLLQYAVENKIDRFLLVSSGGVYGPQPELMDKIAESFNGMADPLDSENAYSVGKRTAEHLCALYQNQYGIRTVVARCFSFVGAHLAEWLLVLTARGKAGEAYNVGSDEPITILELAQLVSDLVSRGKVVKTQHKLYSQQRRRYVPSIEKARFDLGLDLRYSLNQGIISTAKAAMLSNLQEP